MTGKPNKQLCTVYHRKAVCTVKLRVPSASGTAGAGFDSVRVGSF